MLLRHRDPICAAVILVTLLCIFYWNVVFCGKTLLTVFYTFKERGPCGYIGGFEDVCDGAASSWVDIPSAYCINRMLWSGCLPLWNPYNGCGIPLAADWQTGVFFPLKWPFLLWTSGVSWDVFLLGRIFLAGFLTYLFASSIGLGRLAALTSAITYMFSGYFACWNNLFHLNVDVMLPLLMLAVEMNVRQPSRAHFILGAVSVSLIILGGNPQPAIIGMILATCYFLWRIGQKKAMGQSSHLFPEAVRYCLMCVAGVGLSAYALLPFMELLRNSSHAHIRVGLGFDDVRTVSTILFPHFFCVTCWQGIFRVPYIGVVAFMLAFCGIGGRGERRLISFFFAVYGIVILCKIYGAPFINWIGAITPFNYIIWNRYTATFHFSAACLAGRGVDNILRGDAGKRQIMFFIGAMVGILVFTIFCCYNEGSARAVSAWLFSMQGLTSLIVVIVPFVFVYENAVRPGSWNPKLVAWLVVIFLLMELFLYIPRRRATRYELSHEPPFITYLKDKQKEEGQPFRVYATRLVMIPQSSSVYGIQDIRTFSPLNVVWYQKLIDHLVDFKGLPAPFQRALFATPRFDILQEPLLNLMNVKYVISEGDFRITTVAHQPHSDVLFGPLRRGKEWGQTFQAEHDGLCGVRIRFNTFGRKGRRAVSLHLRNSPEERGDIVSQVVDATSISDGDFYEFSFPPQWHSKGRSYYVAFTYRHAPRRWAVGVWGARGNRYTGGSAFVDGNTANGDICFEAVYEVSPEMSRRYRKVFSDAECGVAVYENMDVMPRAFLVKKAFLINNDDEIADHLIKADNAELRGVVFVPSLPIGYNEDREKTKDGMVVPDESFAKVIRYNYLSSKVEVDMVEPAFLFVSDTHYPGWEVRVDGHPREIIRTDCAFRSVYVPAGRHVVEFKYRPKSFYVGSAVSLLALAMLAIMLLQKDKRK